MRLALWRIDSGVAPLLAQEIARPYAELQSFSSGRTLDGQSDDQWVVPSPLLSGDVPYVRLHFQIDADGKLTSPQVPIGKYRELALDEMVAPTSSPPPSSVSQPSCNA